MELADQIIAINGAIQGYMRTHGVHALKADEAAEIVCKAGILTPNAGPRGTPGFTFRQFLRDIRDSCGYDALYKLLGAKQAHNLPQGHYTLLRFDSPTRESVTGLLDSKPSPVTKLPMQTEGGDQLKDYLEVGLDVVFVGTSVGDESARHQRYYSHPTNRFWDLVNQANLVSDIVGAENDHLILEDKCGLADLVKRKAARSDSRPGKSDFDIEDFRQKVQRYKPKVVAFNGKRAFKEVFGHDPADYGVSDKDIADSFVFVLPSSSGSDTKITFDEKLDWYRKLNAFIRTL